MIFIVLGAALHHPCGLHGEDRLGIATAGHCRTLVKPGSTSVTNGGGRIPELGKIIHWQSAVWSCAGGSSLTLESSGLVKAQLLGFLLYGTAASVDEVLCVYGSGSAASETTTSSLQQLEGPSPVLLCLARLALGG